MSQEHVEDYRIAVSRYEVQYTSDRPRHQDWVKWSQHRELIDAMDSMYKLKDYEFVIEMRIYDNRENHVAMTGIDDE